MGSNYTVNGTTTGLGTLYGLGYSYITVGGSSWANKHQVHFALNGTASVSIDLAGGNINAVGEVIAPKFTGNLTGNVTGTVSGSAGSTANWAGNTYTNSNITNEVYLMTSTNGTA